MSDQPAPTVSVSASRFVNVAVCATCGASQIAETFDRSVEPMSIEQIARNHYDPRTGKACTANTPKYLPVLYTPPTDKKPT